jgi:hypothetical protein
LAVLKLYRADRSEKLHKGGAKPTRGRAFGHGTANQSLCLFGKAAAATACPRLKAPLELEIDIADQEVRHCDITDITMSDLLASDIA